MNEFDSWQSYSRYAFLVRKKSRYVFNEEIDRFLNALIFTGKKRSIKIAKDGVLFRAQRGCASRPIYDEQGEQIDDDNWPYSKTRMFPIEGGSLAGRANPKGISYLYLANDRDTACAEVRPWKGSVLSLGLFKIKRDLQIIDCTKVSEKIRIYFEEPAPEIRENCVWDDINNAFSKPINPNDPETDYVPTQIIAEIFREEGYDGIAYKSSYGRGYNIVLFNINAVEIIGCWIVETNDIKFQFEHIDIGYGKNLKIEEPKINDRVLIWNNLRAKYKPASIDILFVGESPPNPKKGKFFYEGGQLLKHTRRAFEITCCNFNAGLTDVQFLKEFKKYGCYLDDISHLPFAGLTESERNFQLLSSLDSFINRLNRYSPKYVISFVSRTDFFVKSAIDKSEINPLEVHYLPFPSHKQQRIDDYLNRLSGILINTKKNRSK